MEALQFRKEDSKLGLRILQGRRLPFIYPFLLWEAGRQDKQPD